MARPRKHQIFVGMRHGHLKVIREAGMDHRSIGLYEVKCDCGKRAILRRNHFIPERKFCTRQCRLLSEHRIVDIEGEKFARWTVIRRAHIDPKTGWLMWWCRCECGTKRKVYGSLLIAGESRSCGCLLGDMKRAGRTPEQLAQARKDTHKTWRLNNAAKIRAVTIRYKRKLAKATPSWLTEVHWAAMNAVYEKARKKTRKRGVQYDVDHIVPICGKTVSGLHVPWNLQILTHTANVRKSNRYAELLGD